MRPDIEQAIKAFGNKKSQPNKKELKAVENLLRADETVIFIADTILEVSTSGKKKEKFPGVCVLTSRRFLHHKNEYKLFGIGVGGDSMEAISLDRIDSVNAMSTITYNHVQFHAMTKSYDILCSSKKEMKMLAEAFETAIQDYTTQRIVPAQASDPLAQIKQLSELRDAGAISDDEFEAKKSDLLSRL